MPEPDLYSVRCERCDCTFAVGTKQCVHCGAPISGGLLGALRSAGASGGGEGSGEIDAEELQTGRNWLWVISAAAFMGLTIMQRCN